MWRFNGLTLSTSPFSFGNIDVEVAGRDTTIVRDFLSAFSISNAMNEVPRANTQTILIIIILTNSNTQRKLKPSKM